jgi:hypothetical protein
MSNAEVERALNELKRDIIRRISWEIEGCTGYIGDEDYRNKKGAKAELLARVFATLNGTPPLDDEEEVNP